MILAVFTLTASAQQRVTSRPLSLEECIRIALEHNLEIQIRRLDPQLAGFTLSSSYASYDPTLSFGARHDYNLSSGGLDDLNRPYGSTESDTENIDAALSGLLPWGLSYNLGTRMSDRHGSAPSLVGTNFVLEPFENSTANVGVFSMRQPLLKNFWIDQTRLQIFLNKKDLQKSELGLCD